MCFISDLILRFLENEIKFLNNNLRTIKLCSEANLDF